MKKSLLTTLLYLAVAGRATAFLSLNEQRQIRNLQPLLPLDHCRTANTHVGMVNHIAAVAPTFQDLSPDMTVEVMTDISHVALDLTGFLTPSRLHILSFSILGRLLLLYTDCCLQGHSVPPEELAVQAFLLATNLKDLARAIMENR